MKIALSAGHNVYINNNFDCGAVGNGRRESDITKETVNYLMQLLKAQGHSVIDVTPYNEKFKERKDHHVFRCKKVDEFNADLYLDIHVNSGGGTGVECWVYSKNSKSYPYAENICENISKSMGLTNRGVKVNPSYWSLSLCKAPAIIVEGAFIDNKTDMEKLTPKKYAEAIAMSFGEIKNNEIELDEIKIKLHDKDITVKGIYEKGTNYIPVRFLERLGYKIDWVNGIVTIDYNDGQD